jgi:hypothetical protein
VVRISKAVVQSLITEGAEQDEETPEGRADQALECLLVLGGADVEADPDMC